VLHHRVRSLENINIDLEYRLEQQAKATLAAESKYTDIDMSWRAKYEELEKVVFSCLFAIVVIFEVGDSGVAK